MTNWLYRIFASLKTSIWLLGLLVLWYLLGTLFPQGVEFEKYKEAGGKYLFAVKVLDLLHVFSSPVFLFLTFLLVLNIIFCIYSRINAYLKSSLKLPEAQIIANADWRLDAKYEGTLLSFLQKKGLKTIYKDDTQTVLQKGFPVWWASWLFHIAMAIAIIGFFVTFLSAYESELTLYPGKTVELSLYSPDTRWNRLLKGLGFSIREKIPERIYKVTLKRFITTYQEKIALNYPRNIPDRLAIGLGIVGLTAAKKPEPYPLQYMTEFVIETPDGSQMEAKLSVNHPFRKGPLTLYQMGFEQKIILQIDEKSIEVKPYEPFKVKGLKDRFILYTLKQGEMIKKDGSVARLKPQAWLYKIEGSKKRKLALLKKGKDVLIEGKRWSIKTFREASVLSYRIDRGVPIAATGVVLLMLALFLRVYGCFYRLRILKKEGLLYLQVQSGVLFASSSALIKEFYSFKITQENSL